MHLRLKNILIVLFSSRHENHTIVSRSPWDTYVKSLQSALAFCVIYQFSVRLYSGFQLRIRVILVSWVYLSRFRYLRSRKTGKSVLFGYLHSILVFRQQRAYSFVAINIIENKERISPVNRVVSRIPFLRWLSIFVSFFGIFNMGLIKAEKCRLQKQTSLKTKTEMWNKKGQKQLDCSSLSLAK